MAIKQNNKFMNMAVHPNTKTVCLTHGNGKISSVFDVIFLACSIPLNTANPTKHKLKIKTTLAKNFILKCNIIYPFLPANIGTKEKLSKASSSYPPSALLVKRNIR